MKSGENEMTILCPKCKSKQVLTKHTARKIGGTLGTTAGTVGGVTTALSAAQVGASIGIVAGPIGSIFGGLAGAVVGGLVGGVAGCSAGTALGEMVDTTILDNHECVRCGHCFSLSRVDETSSADHY